MSSPLTIPPPPSSTPPPPPPPPSPPATTTMTTTPPPDATADEASAPPPPPPPPPIPPAASASPALGRPPPKPGTVPVNAAFTPPPPIPNRRSLLSQVKTSSLELSRRDLKQNLEKRTRSLTRAESEFLNDLAEYGDEAELQLALKRLQDEELFPDAPEETPQASGMTDESTRTWPGHFQVGVEREASANSVFSVEENTEVMMHNSTTSTAAIAGAAQMTASMNGPRGRAPSPATGSLGSNRRQELLQSRKQESMVFGKRMWKAHETGLSVSLNASRRSLLKRQSTVGQSTSRRNLMLASNKMDQSDGGINSSINSSGLGFNVRPGSSSRRLVVMERSDNSMNTSINSIRHLLLNDSGPSSSALLPSLPRRSMGNDSSRNSSRRLSSSGNRLQRNISASLLLKQTGLGGYVSRKQMMQHLNQSQSKSNVLMNDFRSDNNRRVSWSQQHSADIFSQQNQSHRKSLTHSAAPGAGGALHDPFLASRQLPRPQKINQHSRRATYDAAAISSAQQEFQSEIQQQQQQQQQLQGPFTSPPPLPRPNPKELKRLMSDGTRKSVTFGELPSPRGDLTDDFFRAIKPEIGEDGEEPDGGMDASGLSVASPAAASTTPSLHLAHPIRSQSFRSTAESDAGTAITGGPPSLHMAHPIRSQSFRSTTTESEIGGPGSIHLAHPIMSQSFRSTRSGNYDYDEVAAGAYHYRDDARDPSNVGEQRDEKKQADGADEDLDALGQHDKPPLVVVLEHHGHGQGDTAIEIPVDGKPQEPCLRRPVLIREASNNYDEGEGIEIADFADLVTEQHNLQFNQGSNENSVDKARRLESLISFGNASETSDNGAGFQGNIDYRNIGIILSNSYDECMSYGRVSDIFRKTNTQSIRRSLSDDDINGILVGQASKWLMHDYNTTNLTDDDNASWLIDDEDITENDGLIPYDPWRAMDEGYEDAFGGGFAILGTSADDVDSHPHVLSPPLMESLVAFVPWSQQGTNFWLKYSLVRDGASMHTFLQHARGSKYCFLAIETVDGEVFGAFTSEPWRKNWNYFGGYESFLWRLRHSRKDQKCTSIIDQSQKESEIDVYPFTGENDHVQLCTSEKLGIGGGAGSSDFLPEDRSAADNELISEHEWGYGMVVYADMLHGSSSPCLTFGSPALCREHSDCSVFEIMNMELWTMTPCVTVEQAEKMEVGRLFLETHSQPSF